MFRMTIADVFVIRGRGSVATGRIEDGALRVGDEVLIAGRGPVRVDGIEMFRKVVDQAQAGDNVGLLFKTLDKSELTRGAVISAAGDAPPYTVPSGREAPAPAAQTEGEAPAPGSGRDPRFASTETQRTQFLEMRGAGLMTEAQIDESLRSLIFTTDHRQWLLRARSESWYSSLDGTDWREDSPPGG